MNLLIILLLAMITFGTRYLFLHPSLPLRLKPKMIKFLSFSAPAVLTAIWVPIIFIHEGKLTTSVVNPYLWGAIAALVVAHKSKNLYWTIAIGLVVFILVKMYIA